MSEMPVDHLVPQRFVRPLDTHPGFMKELLPTKYLALAARGDIDDLRRLLAEHPEYLSKRSSHNRTLLWTAAYRGRLPAVQWLVEQGAELNATGSYNRDSLVQLTPHCAAVYYNHPAVAEYLLGQGAEIDIFRAAFLGDIDRVAGYLAADPGLVNAEDPHDPIYYVPPLSFAVVGGHLEMLEYLLQHGAQAAPYSDQLVGRAVNERRKDIIALLIRHQVRMDAVSIGVFVDSPDLDMLRFLLDNGVSPVRAHENGFTPLIYLSRGDKGEHPEKIQLLLDYGAPVDRLGPKGRSALHYAAAAGFLKVMTLLLDHGADASLRDASGATPLDLARQNKKGEAVALLKRRGAESTTDFSNGFHG